MGELEKVGESCEGLSGRAMRKLAIVAMGIVGVADEMFPVAAGEFVRALDVAARKMLA